MADAAQPTRPSLIVQLRDAGNESAWGQFVEIYTPLVFGYCRNRGLQEKESTWLAFWMTAVENQEAKDVAATLNVSVGAVYIAKSRVLARLRECIEGVDEECVSDF